MTPRLLSSVATATLLLACNRPSASGAGPTASASAAEPTISPEGATVDPARRARATAAVRQVFGPDATAPLYFVGNGEAAIAREPKAGVCAVVIEAGDSWRMVKMQKGGALDVTGVSLSTHGSMQETVTLEDLKAVYQARCR